MYSKILRYIFCNGSVYLVCYIILKIFSGFPDGPEAYVWHVPVYPLVLLPMILINVLYLSGFLGDMVRKLDELDGK